MFKRTSKCSVPEPKLRSGSSGTCEDDCAARCLKVVMFLLCESKKSLKSHKYSYYQITNKFVLYELFSN